MIGSLLILNKTWFKPGVWNLEQFDPDPFIDALNYMDYQTKLLN